MKIRFYLAMTADEMAGCAQLPPNPGWMACHFSPYGLALTDLPQTLPPEALLCCDDRIPIFRHDPDLVAAQLADAAKELACGAILLDFQLPEQPLTAQVVRAVCAAAPCPVAVTPGYAAESTGPVLLPPPKLWEPPSQWACPWKRRELWMEWGPQAAKIQVTASGSVFLPLEQRPAPSAADQTDESLHCRYRLELAPEQADFYLWDDRETLAQKQSLAEKWGVTTFVGLYQQFQALEANHS